MSYQLKGLYLITDDILTPDETIYTQVESALINGVTIVQLRDKKNNDNTIEQKAIKLQKLCKKYNALFVLNDKVDLAIKLQCDGLHIGKSDYENFTQIRKDFKGIIGVSCYGEVSVAQKFQTLGANYVAFGSFYSSAIKPDSNIVPLETLQIAKDKLNIPICAIGGIKEENITNIINQRPDMICMISDIWNASNISKKINFYKSQF